MQVKEVKTWFRMWYKFKDFIDFKEKDVIESYLKEKLKDQFNEKSEYNKPFFSKTIKSR